MTWQSNQQAPRRQCGVSLIEQLMVLAIIGVLVTQGRRVVFCPSVDAASCAQSTHWEHGWVLGVDGDHDNQPDGTPRYTGGARKARVAIRSSVGRQLVRFQPDGSAGGSNLTLTFCNTDAAAPALNVIISNSGRVRGAPASDAQAQACAQAN